jgi:hypothetical protein
MQWNAHQEGSPPRILNQYEDVETINGPSELGFNPKNWGRLHGFFQAT